MVIKEPLEIDYDNEEIESIVEKIENAIEQHPSFLKVIPESEIMAQEALNEQRRYSAKTQKDKEKKEKKKAKKAQIKAEQEAKKGEDNKDQTAS
jgi:type I restriction-modification system DNA methylase subunit